MSLCWTFTAKILTPIYTLGTLAKNINIQKSYEFSLIDVLLELFLWSRGSHSTLSLRKSNPLTSFTKLKINNDNNLYGKNLGSEVVVALLYK